jgi:Uma2 family endonuclease
MSSVPTSLTGEPEYAWEIATLYPEQGSWSEEEYLSFTDRTNRLVEFADGRVEFLPMPTELHQALVEYVYLALRDFVERRQLGKVRFAGMRLRIRSGKYREPDVLFLRTENFHLRHNRVWHGADLVVEVVSDDPKDRQRDYVAKLADYAACPVAEYWIIDPETQLVTVHRSHSDKYAIHGEFAPGERATSVLLQDFAVDVAALFESTADVNE